MKIHRIHLKNYKCFEDSTFELNPQVTVLIGDNGKGKTAILDAISIAASTFLKDISEARSRYPQADEIRIKDFGHHLERQLPLEITAIGQLEVDEFEWFIKLDKIPKHKKEVIFGEEMPKKGRMYAEKVRAGDKINLPIISFYKTERLWKRSNNQIDTQPRGSRLQLGYKDSLAASSKADNFLGWIKTSEIVTLQRQAINPALEAVKKAIANCVDEWQEIYYDFEEEDLVGKTQEEGTGRLPFRMMSDGVRNMIGMVADIAYRCVMLNPHLEENATLETEGIVLIDELDLHIHPSWQKRVVDDLKRTFPKIQFVASTHSPFIVQSLNTDELINLDRDTDMNLKGMGIEEISEAVMGVEHKKSKAFTDMEEVATTYYKLVDKGVKAENEDELEKIKAELDKLLIPYSEDPAFTAQLKMDRLARLGK